MTDGNAPEFGSREAGKKGGDARAKALSKEEKQEIARKAANARWGTPIMHAMCAGDIRLADGTVIACAVLEDKKTRVISQRGFSEAVGASKPSALTRRGAGEMPALFTAANLKPFISNDLAATAKPLEYYPEHGGRTALGIRAEAMAPLLRVWVDADEAGKLHERQKPFAIKARILLHALAGVAVVALIDEATGFQDRREKDALVRILEEFVAKELQDWVRTFSLDFFRELCKIRKVEFGENHRYPKFFGTLVNNIVYSRLAPGVLETLQEKNPVSPAGTRAHKHHQHLTPAVGHPKLRELLGSVTTLLKLSNRQGHTWDQFIEVLDTVHPKYREAPLFQEQMDRDAQV